MADFDDITGWRDELAAFKEHEEGVAYYNKYDLLSDQIPKLPYETIVHLAELMFPNQDKLDFLDGRDDLEEQMYAFEDLYWYFNRSAAWDLLMQNAPQGFIDLTDPYWVLNPFDAHVTLGDFRDWYAMKTRCPYNLKALNHARVIAVNVYNRMFSSVRSPEAKLHYQTQQPHLSDYIEF